MYRSVVRFALAILVTSAVKGRAQSTVSTAQYHDFRSGLVLSGDWLQANALPLNRNAMQSGDITLSYRRPLFSIDVGALRVARDLSNVTGGFAGVGPLFAWRGIVVHPAVDVLVGRGEASADSTGFDFVTPSGATGHQAQFTYSSASTVGIGGSLTVDVPVYRMIALHLAASEWRFSGHPLSLDRTRTLLGAGLALRVLP
jgi:hypothetical protein